MNGCGTRSLHFKGSMRPVSQKQINYLKQLESQYKIKILWDMKYSYEASNKIESILRAIKHGEVQKRVA